MKLFFKTLFFVSIIIFFNCSNEYNRRYRAAKRLSQSQKMEDWEKAIKQYDEIINIKINAREYQALIYRKLGQKHLSLEHWNDALYNFKKATEILPTNGLLHYYIGVCYSQLSRSTIDEKEKIDLIKIAEEEYKLSLKLNPNLIDPLYGLGIIYFYVWNDYNKGIEYMAKVLKKDPKNIDAHFALARFYYENGEPIKSLEFYKSLLSLLPKKSPKIKTVQENISRIYMELQTP